MYYGIPTICVQLFVFVKVVVFQQERFKKNVIFPSKKMSIPTQLSNGNFGFIVNQNRVSIIVFES